MEPAFQRTKVCKEWPDPDREAKPDRIEEMVDRFSDRVFAFDEFHRRLRPGPPETT
ncbi:hypothetical protein [Streptomyces sp. GESEQ-35]|uniref:hypothetical protein n=1 Tax=Streptomyces sp. GESEQ-35 TaxID=2812657 RepID=UPI0027E35527|nr:hypothetical protein [Streptomyces sp. GESEQ-35]